MHFGRFSLLLGVGALNALILASLLWHRGVNRPANRTLALLVTLVALRLVPYVLGYAGAYDEHPWLTFAPFDLSLAFGPLLWAYVVALTTGHFPAPTWPHVVLPSAQFAYQLCCFALPLPAKWDWYVGAHLQVAEPAGALLALLSLTAYLWAAWRILVAYHHWLDGQYSTTEVWRLDWLYQILGAVAVVVTLGCAFALVNWFVIPLSYIDRLPQMIAFAVLAYVLGALGWRYGEIVYPVLAVRSAEGTVDAAYASPHDGTEPPAADVAGAELRYARLAEQWSATVYRSEWWRDESLTLTSLASRLGTSPRTLSRVLGEGGGTSFHEFINGMRVRWVSAVLTDERETRDVLAIALDAGFNSKASFNRAFKTYAGITPSEFRRQAHRGAVVDVHPTGAHPRYGHQHYLAEHAARTRAVSEAT